MKKSVKTVVLIQSLRLFSELQKRLATLRPIGTAISRKSPRDSRR